MISALFLLVVLSALGAAMARLSVRQHMGSASELEAARGLQVARAGLEWAAFQVLRNPPPPGAAPACFATTSFSLAALASFTVTVSCTRTTGTDAGQSLVFFNLVANACNAPTGGNCPSTGTPGLTYVERQINWTLVR